MARTLLLTVLLVAVAALAPATNAQAPAPTRAPVTYTVGDAAGWNVLGDDAYDNWEENKIFYVGDILVFNFINGTQDVAEVTEAAYDSCNTTSPISLATNPPVRITLTTPGDHYYTSTLSGHCSRDQKLSIDVLASTTTTPSTPPPSATTPTASPTPTRTPVTYIVGDAAGWNVLTDDAYDQWEENKTFYVGDILVFNFINGTQDVAEVTEAAYDSCNTTSPLSLSTNPPVRITLTTPGEHYYTSTLSGHCSSDQKLSIDVLASATTTPSTPPPSATTPTAAPTPTRTPVTYIVGDTAGWNVLTDDAYDQWEENKTFYVGDILVFNFINGTQDVAEVTEAAYDSCNTTSPISLATNPPVRITLTTPGDHYYTSTLSGHCSRDQKLSIDVLASTTSTPSTPPPSATTPTAAPTPTRTPVTYIVGDAAGWNVLTDDAYDQWEENKTFYVGDILVFNFINGTQDVAEVTEAAYDSCNTTSPLSLATNPPVRITLTTPGEHYYTSTLSGHCSRDQKLSIDVLASTTTTPSTPPPSATTPTAAPTPTRTPVTYIVGDTAGWNVLTDDAYDQWEENKTFYVGDILVFNFINGTQDVAEVTEAAYDSCNTTSPLSLLTNPPVRITLTTPGEHYYTSTLSGHCSSDQKLSIDVLASSTTTGTTSSPSGSTSPSPSNDNSASSVGVTALFSMILSAVVAVSMF